MDISVQPTLLRARVSAFYAKPPFGPMEPGTPDDDSESGRGLALIQALVTTVTFERQDGTNTWVLSRTRHRLSPRPVPGSPGPGRLLGAGSRPALDARWRSAPKSWRRRRAFR